MKIQSIAPCVAFSEGLKRVNTRQDVNTKPVHTRRDGLYLNIIFWKIKIILNYSLYFSVNFIRCKIIGKLDGLYFELTGIRESETSVVEMIP